MKTRTVLTAVIAFLCLPAFSASQSKATIVASQTKAIVWSSSPFGIAFGQTARVSLLNTSDHAIIINDFKFLDGDGSVFGEFRGEIAPGRMIFFDLNRDTLARDTNRHEIYAQIEASRSNLTGVVASVEVFDNADGKTTLFFQDRSIGDPGIRTNPSFVEPPDPESTTSGPDSSANGQ